MLLTPISSSSLQDLVTSLLMWLAVFLYSPLLALLSAQGAVLGSALPLLFLGLLFFTQQKVFISELQLLKTIPPSTLVSGATAASCPWPPWPGHNSPSQRECLHVCLLILIKQVFVSFPENQFSWVLSMWCALSLPRRLSSELSAR